jgi:hypothetical protein
MVTSRESTGESLCTLKGVGLLAMKQRRMYLTFEILMAVKMSIAVFWVVTSCGHVRGYQHRLLHALAYNTLYGPPSNHQTDRNETRGDRRIL